MKIATKHIPVLGITGILVIIVTCALISFSTPSSHQQMINLLNELSKRYHDVDNPFNPELKIARYDSLEKNGGIIQNFGALRAKAPLMLEVGKEQECINIYKLLSEKTTSTSEGSTLLSEAGIAYMRLGERSNCMLNHNRSSCIFPIKDAGVHRIQTGSRNAIDTYEDILKNHPNDLVSKWLLNIAFMTLGRYPQEVPAKYLIPDLNKDRSGVKVNAFTDVAGDLGLDAFGRAGGAIVDDFNNDGYLDIVTSAWDLTDPMHYFQNNKDGTFTDKADEIGLKGITGGLNIQQTDYNNDGYMDIFVLRGAWNKEGYGNQPSSLLRNNGDGTFTDVTIPSGLLFFHPTQAAVWADFNNDGWLDVYIGAENADFFDAGGQHTSMLYINNRNGTFTNVAKTAHCDVTAFVKGVTSADYNNDGWADIFVSTLNGEKHLLKNKAKAGAIPDFEDVTTDAGIKIERGTFTTWFFDYDNDGWPDIMAADYSYSLPLSHYSAAEALGKPIPNAGNIFLFHNNRNGTFTDLTKQTGLDKVVFSMGANFGDIDNDGYLDMYFGTGNPDFRSLIPNKLFKNIDGKRFSDITVASRVGNLQKGHGVAFADLRNAGLQDILTKTGGAYVGDSYNSSLYVNPGQSNNNWISLKCEGIKANRAAIGSRIKLTFTDNGRKRTVYKDVNSGGSFGSSPLRQEIGIGMAKVIDDIEIRWAGSNAVQHFRNVAPCQFLQVTEGIANPVVIHLNKLAFAHKSESAMCLPMAASLKL